MSEKIWNFPNNNGTITKGISDAGIETFKGNLLTSLAREICQNSLDAKRVGQSVVKVEFKNHYIIPSKFPGIEDFKEVFNNLDRYWSKNSPPAKTFLNRAKLLLKSNSISVLRVSDYNTTGLSDPYGNSSNSLWHNITKVDGGSTKSSDKAGGFGIGKNAPFANSSFRTVFYRTLNENNEKAIQGISRLPSFPIDFDRVNETMTLGLGYYGNPEGNLAIENLEVFDNINLRTEIGTDLFICGFDVITNQNWKEDIIIEVLSSFLLPVYNGELEVSVGDKIINKNTLNELMVSYIKYEKSHKTCYSNYLVLTSEHTKVYRHNLGNLGELKLSLLVDNFLDLDNKILRTRLSGMKLFALGNYPKMVKFSGILELDGDAISEFFKVLEPPAHDKWEPDRYLENPSLARSLIRDIRAFEIEVISSYFSNEVNENFSLTGLGEELSSDNKSDNGAVNEIEVLSDEIEEHVSNKQKTVEETHVIIIGGGTNKSKNVNRVKGRVDDTSGKIAAIRTRKGDKKASNKTPHKGVVDPQGDDVVLDDIKRGETHLENVRIFKLSEKSYQLSFVSPIDIRNGHIEIHTVGENNRQNQLNVVSASEKSNCNGLTLSTNNIKFNNINVGNKTKIIFELADNRNYALEVKVYED